MGKLFTSESVTEGHPDKICDQISDAVLDAIIEQDKNGRVACETVVNTGLVLLVGEISTRAYVDIPRIVRNTISDIGYNNSKFGFNASNCAVITSIDEQSSDIALGVDESLEAREGEEADIEAIGAGDQGMVFGFAINETPEYLPLPISLAHKLSRRLAEVRKKGIIPYLGPDGKTQVTVEYEGDKPLRVDTVLISSQHEENIDHDEIEKDIVDKVIKVIIPEELVDSNTKYLVNPTGRFVKGGPEADSGLTGRKIIVDTYGGYARHGGGAFSGKDPTKVDRSGAYAARWVAKNLVAAGIADKIEVEVAYAIGVAKPVSISVDTFGTGKIDDDRIIEIIDKIFDLRPAAIIRDLDLKRPIYRKTAAYGHFGRTDIDLPWERLNKVDEIKRELEESVSIFK
ncbi:methionine adenosyltransferase [Clostridium luticellarii]|jgi:S-adenosylmethionine synthetase|uniref:S-adenosylmethionine synthase n=1 Tax=Clostridium luticellarii TaxID=1691940 RepID=A0A2T0BPM7_9CLOT|nr:methionine adenosyltransferase [Clostridium luticellarii]MCI1945372.1 methionine adenosyltransferase [Clostridium luticellarii]MCI1968663.1 methionine adenosyltransferase [Clostridium luticellarii]MCI1996994.1 methionine adenosyltransferase [Clostridium luticellarii]MCI2040421.1 methionine adenosyltransferase [Clostridium luticellarii]PRR85785.1 S-adenosylmethionine synthase [Clostridium luticellarii]